MSGWSRNIDTMQHSFKTMTWRRRLLFFILCSRLPNDLSEVASKSHLPTFVKAYSAASSISSSVISAALNATDTTDAPETA